MEKEISKYDAECLVEVDSVLYHLNPQELKKIPLDDRDAINEFKSLDYVWVYDESKSLLEQSLRRESIDMLAYLNTEYLLDDEQRKLMDQIHIVNEYKEDEAINKELANKKDKESIIKRLFKLGE